MAGRQTCRNPQRLKVQSDPVMHRRHVIPAYCHPADRLKCKPNSLHHKYEDRTTEQTAALNVTLMELGSMASHSTCMPPREEGPG